MMIIVIIFGVMIQKNIQLQVRLGKISLDLNQRTQIIFSLFLSFAKKSKQIQRQKLISTSSPPTFLIDQSLRIQYDQLNLSKHKYCLLFIYQISQTGRKRVIGNVPINILKSNNQGTEVLQLEECQDKNATIEVAVKLHYQCKEEDQLSCKTFSLDRHGMLANKMVNSKSRFSAKNIHQRRESGESGKSPQSLHRFQYQSLKDENGLFGKETPKMNMTSSKTELDLHEATNNLVTIEPLTFETKEDSIVNIGLDHVQENKVAENEQCCSNTSLEMGMKETAIQESQTRNQILQTFGTLGHDFSGSAPTPRLPTIQRKVQTYPIFAFVPSTLSKTHKTMTITKVIGLQYKGVPPAQPQISQNLLQHLLSKHPPSLQQAPTFSPKARKEVLLSNLSEIKIFTKHITALQQRCNVLISTNEDLAAESNTLKEMLVQSKKEAEQDAEFYNSTIKELMEKLRVSDSLCEQYYSMSEDKEKKIREFQVVEEQLVRENNSLKDKLKESSKMISELKQDLFSLQCHSEDSFIKNEEKHEMPSQQKYKHPSKRNLQIEIDNNAVYNTNYESESQNTFGNLYETKRVVPCFDAKPKNRTGKIVSNKTRGFPGTPSSQSIQLMSKTELNQSNVSCTSKDYQNYSEIIKPEVTTPKKGYLIDYLEIEAKGHSIPVPVPKVAKERYEGSSVTSKDTVKQKNYFMNNKYKEKGSEGKEAK